MRSWVMLLVLCGLAACEGGWRPSVSREADELWRATRRCEVTMTTPVIDGLQLERTVTIATPEQRLDRALAAYATTAGCDGGCRARAAAIQAQDGGVAACRAAAKLLHDTSIAGYDREPRLQDAAMLWLRWFLSSYWVLVALALAIGMIAGKLGGDDAFGLLVGGIVLFPALRLVAGVPSYFWIGFGIVIAVGVAVIAVYHLRKTRPRALGGLEFALGLASLGFGLWGLASLQGTAGVGAIVLGAFASIIQCGHAVYTMNAAPAGPRET